MISQPSVAQERVIPTITETELPITFRESYPATQATAVGQAVEDLAESIESLKEKECKVLLAIAEL